MPGEDVGRDLSTGRGVRAACRAGGFAGTTSGIAPGFVQSDLAVLPRDLAGELPVFPGCGVTPQSVIEAALPPFAITHAPGCMLVTDRRNTEFAIL